MINLKANPGGGGAGTKTFMLCLIVQVKQFGSIYNTDKA